MHPDALVDTLHAAGPDTLLANLLQLFGHFVGALDLTWHGPDHTGQLIAVPGTLHVGWILDGRAVQDVWQVPSDSADVARMRGFHGTTIRFYDPVADAWRSTWLDPVNGRVRRFLGRQVDGDIVLEGLDPDPQERWRFCGITGDTFHWIGEESQDGGTTWQMVDQMHARRRSPGQVPGPFTGRDEEAPR